MLVGELKKLLITIPDNVPLKVMGEQTGIVDKVIPMVEISKDAPARVIGLVLKSGV